MLEVLVMLGIAIRGMASWNSIVDAENRSERAAKENKKKYWIDRNGKIHNTKTGLVIKKPDIMRIRFSPKIKNKERMYGVYLYSTPHTMWENGEGAVEYFKDFRDAQNFAIELNKLNDEYYVVELVYR